MPEETDLALSKGTLFEGQFEASVLESLEDRPEPVKMLLSSLRKHNNVIYVDEPIVNAPVEFPVLLTTTHNWRTVLRFRRAKPHTPPSGGDDHVNPQICAAGCACNVV
ncbi:hypothetical protein ElyMa_003736500 [Elysia marginata]|uniref:Uncharacterized protein n=1 Tax=Elysia marginata TaxID=1093978 RepID=A0AAV4F8G0_9GAST|nr:hypothetical protein ElyMa_003736500 [Elysia marginata]